jgi:hypothetical protein
MFRPCQVIIRLALEHFGYADGVITLFICTATHKGMYNIKTEINTFALQSSIQQNQINYMENSNCLELNSK